MYPNAAVLFTNHKKMSESAATRDPSDGSHQAFSIGGIPVLFPAGKKPFPAQLAVMSKVMQALKERKNALLESPTGTGKVSTINVVVIAI